MDVIEFQILYTLQELRTPLVDGLMVFITSLGDHGWFWILMGVLLFSFPRTRILGGCMLISIAAGFLLGNVMLKNIAARQRPCWLDPSVELLVAVPKDFSFPSGHSLVSFEGAVCIFLFNGAYRVFQAVSLCTFSNGCAGGNRHGNRNRVVRCEDSEKANGKNRPDVRETMTWRQAGQRIWL